MLGRKIVTLLEGPVAAGEHVTTFDASGLPSGTYIYRLETPTRSLSRTMLLLKWWISEAFGSSSDDTESLMIRSDQDSANRSHDCLSRLLFEDGVRISHSKRDCKDNP